MIEKAVIMIEPLVSSLISFHIEMYSVQYMYVHIKYHFKRS